jgi:hypothetical protein
MRSAVIGFAALALALVGARAAEAQPSCPTTAILNATTAFGMAPNKPRQDSTPLFAEAIACAQSNKGRYRTITVDPGEYYFLSPAPGTYRQHVAYIPVVGVSGVVFDFQGATLLFTQAADLGFYMQDCDACVLERLSLDYADLPFTQLLVVDVDAQQKRIDVVPQRASAGHFRAPAALFAAQCAAVACYDTKKQQYAQIAYGFDLREGRPQYAWGRWDVSEPIKPGASLQLSGDTSTIRTGDVFELEMRSGGPAIFVEGGIGTRVQDVAIYASAGPGLIAESASLFEVRRVAITPKPGTNRLVSTNAGGIQLNAMGPGNLVLNSHVVRAQDDSIAGNADVLGTTEAPVAGQSNRVVTLTRKPPSLIAPGLKLFFVDPVTALPIAGQGNFDFTVQAVDNNTVSFTEVLPQQVQNAAAVLVPTAAGLRGAGLVIAGNTVQDSLFARGIALSGVSDALVLRNVVDSTQQAGILLNGDGTSYGPLRHIAVGGNALRDTDQGLAEIGPAMLGAIEVTSLNAEGQVIATMPASRIDLADNLIDSTPRSGIWVESVASGTVADNAIIGSGGNPQIGIDPHLPSGLGKQQAMQDFAKPVVLLGSDVRMRSNTVDRQ